MKKAIRLILLLLFISPTLFANEGMWIPSLLKKLNEQELKARGLKIPVEQIWSVQNASIKDAIVQFGGGCTAEVISYKGLLLTNHHCGYSQIQAHSTLENDYLKNGFWAMDYSKELPNPGLTAMFVVSMDDVTEIILKDVRDENGKINQAKLKRNIENLEKKSTEGTHYEAEVVPFNYGNSYFLILTETFKDVRLVGAPPSSIGKFGGDTDNWVWPRHTGDFSIFRIYADKNNQPAEYSKDNVPYQPKYALPVSTIGVKEGDFTMVFGFPGRTQQFLSAAAVEQIVLNTNPARIKMREKALSIIDADMRSSDLLRIKYAAKQARISNAYKKWIGETKGLLRLNAIAKKKELEAEYKNRAAKNPDHQKRFGNLPDQFTGVYSKFKPYAAANDYFFELVFSGPEFIRYAQRFEGIIEFYHDESKRADIDASIKKNLESVPGFFKDYNLETDKKLFLALFPLYLEGTPADLLPTDIETLKKKYKNDWNLMAQEIFSKSFFTDQKRLSDLLANFNKSSVKKVQADPGYKFMRMIYNAYREKVDQSFRKYSAEIENMMNEYVAGMMLLMPEKKFWYDANSTMRLSYGIVEGSQPHDGMKYTYYTTLRGMMEKYIANDPEFDLPKKLIDLSQAKDFGVYGNDGELRVCFTASNHTTGGNSGSPVLDAYGNLIGINFDRSWESTMSDVMYDPEICRNIILDVRYILFVVDKYAGAGHLVKEMNLVGKEQLVRDEISILKKELEKIDDLLKTKQSDVLYFERSRINAQLKLYTEAINDLNTAIKLNPESNHVVYGTYKVKLLMESGKYADAILSADFMLKKNPNLFEIQFDKAVCLSQLKKFDEAAKIFTLCINSKYNEGQAHLNRGICYYNSGKLVEACADFIVAEKLTGVTQDWPRNAICR